MSRRGGWLTSGKNRPRRSRGNWGCRIPTQDWLRSRDADDPPRDGRGGAVLALHALLGGHEQPALVPLRASARLPLCAAEVAELGAAPTGDVVAAEVELDHCGAARAALPALTRAQREHDAVVGVCDTSVRATRLEDRLAVAARPRAAARTRTIENHGRREEAWGGRLRAEERAACGPGAVYALLRPELARLFVECGHRPRSHVHADRGERDVLSAAARREQ